MRHHTRLGRLLPDRAAAPASSDHALQRPLPRRSLLGLSWLGLSCLALAACAVRSPLDERQAPDVSVLESLPPTGVAAEMLPAQGRQAYSAHGLDDVPPLLVPRLHESAGALPSELPREKDEAAAAPYLGLAPTEGAPLTLESAYDLARGNDPQLRGAFEELQAAGYGVVAARAGLLPSVNLEGSYSRVSQNVIESQNTVYQHGKATWKENSYALTLRQPVFDVGVFHKWRQSQESERRELANYAQAQQDLMLRTATAYLSILASIDQLQLTAAERDLTRRQQELVQARYQSGQETQVGLSEVQARLELQDANYLLAQNAYLDRQQALHEIIGYGNVALLPVRLNLELQLPEPLDPQAWLDQALAQNWSIRAAAEAVTVAAREVSVQRAGYYPRLDLQASYGRNETGGSLFGGGSTVGNNRVSLNLNVPLFQGGHTYGMSKAAGSRLNAAQMKLSQTRRGVQRQLNAAFQNIVMGVDRIRALQRSVQAFEQALNLQSESFTHGLTNIVSVLDATRNLYNAKRQEAEARYNYILDTLKLKQAAGTLSDTDIVAISRRVLG